MMSKNQNPLYQTVRRVPALPDLNTIEEATNTACGWELPDQESLNAWRSMSWLDLQDIWSKKLTPLFDAYQKGDPKGQVLEEWFGVSYRQLLTERSALPAIEYIYASTLYNKNANFDQLRSLAHRASDRLYSFDRKLNMIRKTFGEISYSLELLESEGFKKIDGIVEHTQIQLRKQQIEEGYRLAIHYLRIANKGTDVAEMFETFDIPRELKSALIIRPQVKLTGLDLGNLYQVWLSKRIEEINEEVSNNPKRLKHNAKWIRALEKMTANEQGREWKLLAEEKFPLELKALEKLSVELDNKNRQLNHFHRVNNLKNREAS